MQNDVSQFVVNIIPLQNIQTNISGVDPITSLSNSVANLQQMVNYDTKTILVDTLQSYTANSAINVLSPLNLCNIGILSNGVEYGGGSSGVVSTSGGSIQISTGQIEFQVGSTISLSLTETTATFSGTVYGQTFVTLSDERSKSGIEEIKGGILGRLDKLHLYEYRYTGEERKTTGFLAQEVKEIFPDAVVTGVKGNMYVNYDVLVGYLVGAIQELKKEIEMLKHINLKN
jgi:hypothetical protein